MAAELTSCPEAVGKGDTRCYKAYFLEWSRLTCKENRIGFIKMLLSNLSPKGIRDIQGILSKIKKKRRFSSQLTTTNLSDNEDAWFELQESDAVINWAGCTTESELIGYLKLILLNYREDEVREICSSHTYHAREAILYPERSASRRKSVPDQVGWWAEFGENIIGLDCEMISKIVGRKKGGKPRCKQVAGSVSVVSYDYKPIYKAIIKHNPEDVYLTKIAKQITGFNESSFKDVPVA